ncbi:MAG: agmatinase [Desulfobacterales bacterium]
MDEATLIDQIEKLAPGEIAVLGIPFDANSSFLRGPALGPARIREAFRSPAGNRFTENGLGLGGAEGWRFIGDLTWPGADLDLAAVVQSVDQILSRDARVISLGGDHSITHPILRAYGRRYPDLTILHLDAHPDLYDRLGGNSLSHACPFARIMEEGLAQRLVQVGIRTLTPHQREQAERFGVEIVPVARWPQARDLAFEGSVYLSLDLDCLDPAFAPGVSHHEPGGLSTREVLHIIQGFKGNLVGADIVELNPERDWMGMTARVAAKLLKELLGRMLG